MRSAQVPFHFSPLGANAWLVPSATCARSHIYSKDYLGHCTAFQFGLHTRELCFCRSRTGPLAIPSFDFSFMFLSLVIFTTEGEKIIINHNNGVGRFLGTCVQGIIRKLPPATGDLEMMTNCRPWSCVSIISMACPAKSALLEHWI